jgi:uncharacterized protein
MIRAVLDTNVLISALIRPEGLEAQLLQRALDGQLLACVSIELWAEYVEVLGRKKFAKYQDKAAQLLQDLEQVATYYAPLERLLVTADPDDNLLLECSQTAEAAYVVTGNLKDFPTEWKGARIASARLVLNDCGWL